MKLLREITGMEKNERSEVVDKRIKKHYDVSYKDNITPEEKSHVKKFQYDSYLVNNHHWETHKKRMPTYTPPSLKSDIEETTKHMDNVINKSKTPHKLVVYSGTRHDPREIKNENNILHHPAYLSTSLSEVFASGRAKSLSGHNPNRNSHLLKIHVPKDHPGAYIPSITNEAFTNQTEREFTLPRHTNLKYIKTTKDGNTNIHHMKVVP